MPKIKAPVNSIPQFIANVIERSDNGTAMEMFLLSAIISYSENVITLEDNEENNMLVNVENWQHCAMDWIQKIESRYPKSNAKIH